MLNPKQSNTTTPATRTCDLIANARATQGASLRDFAEPLGVSYQQIKNYEAGQMPDRERIAAWICSETPWVHHLGLEIFGAQFANLIQSILVPEAARPCGES